MSTGTKYLITLLIFIQAIFLNCEIRLGFLNDVQESSTLLEEKSNEVNPTNSEDLSKKTLKSLEFLSNLSFSEVPDYDTYVLSIQWPSK